MDQALRNAPGAAGRGDDLEHRLLRARLLGRMGRLDDAIGTATRAYRGAVGPGGSRSLTVQALAVLEELALKAGHPGRALEYRRRASKLARPVGGGAGGFALAAAPDGLASRSSSSGPIPDLDRAPAGGDSGPAPRRRRPAPLRAPDLATLETVIAAHPAAFQRLRRVRSSLDELETLANPLDLPAVDGALPVARLEHDYRVIQKVLSYYRLALKFEDTLGNFRGMALLYADLAYLSHRQDEIFEWLFYAIKAVAAYKGLEAIVMLDGTGWALDRRVLAVSKAVIDVVRRSFGTPGTASRRRIQKARARRSAGFRR